MSCLNGIHRWQGYSADRAATMVDRIYDHVVAVFDTADTDGVNPHVAAKRVGERRLEEVGSIRLRRRPGEGGGSA